MSAILHSSSSGGTYRRAFGGALRTVLLSMLCVTGTRSVWAQPRITSLTNEPICGTMKWTNAAPATFLVQKKINLTDLNWVNLLTTSNNNTRIPKTTDG